MPYLYTAFYDSHIFGCPIARPVWFNYPKDRTVLGLQEQWMMGERIKPCLAVWQQKTPMQCPVFPSNLLALVLSTVNLRYRGLQQAQLLRSNGDRRHPYILSLQRSLLALARPLHAAANRCWGLNGLRATLNNAESSKHLCR